MPEKLTRKELRQDDEFHHWLVRLSDWLVSIRKRLYLIGVLVGVVILASLAWSSVATKKEDRAQAAYTKATQESQAARSALEAQKIKKDGKGAQTEADVKAIDLKEINRFEEVAKSFPKTNAGFQAKLKLAQLYFTAKNYQEASNRFKALADEARNDFFTALVYYGLAYSEEQLGNYDAAEKSFDTVSRQSVPFFESSALFGKARVLGALKKYDEAKKVYEEIGKRWPNSEMSKRSEQLVSLLSPINQ